MSEPPKLPFNVSDKLYFRIGEVSRITNVPASALRFWETQFPGIKPKRTRSGQRLYTQRDLDLILVIKKLLYDHKFTIEGARNHLKTKSETHTRPAMDKNELLKVIRSELEQIRELLG